MFNFRPGNNQLYAEDIPLADLVAQFGSPLYVYSTADIQQRCHDLKTALAPLTPHLHYSVKANSNLAILQLLHEIGLGFDLVSGGELARLQTLNIPLQEVGFAGVGKTQAELEAAIQVGLGFFHIESEAELNRLGTLAANQKQPVQVLLRLNPNVDPHTHKYITTGCARNKFGVNFETAAHLCQKYTTHPWLKIVGVHCHLGSQIQTIGPYLTAAQKILDFIAARRTEGHDLTWLNLGGGFGIPYKAETSLDIESLGQALSALFKGRGIQLIFEPGRYIVARAGLLLMTVQYIKKTVAKTFVVVDAGMHTMLRPALYDGWHKIWPINQAETPETRESTDETIEVDVVGPICESADFLAQSRPLPPLEAGDILAMFDVGAYGMVMASNYNSHPRPAEVLVDGLTAKLIRRRETYADLFALEK